MQRPLTVGVLSPVLGGFYFGAIIGGVARAAGELGGRVLALHTLAPTISERTEQVGEPDFAVPVAMDSIDGYVCIATAVRREYLRRLRDAGKPVVLVSHGVADFPAPVVVPDNYGGVRVAVEHLLGHGHTRIAFVGNLVQRDMIERYDAYRRTLCDHGIEPDPALFFEAPDNLMLGGRTVARRMLAAGLSSTAIMAATDQNAVGLLTELGNAGVRVPDDQAIVGFDDTELALSARPSLASVRQQTADLGILAGRLLLAGIAGEDLPPQEHRCPASFIPRESCGCPHHALRLSPAGDTAGSSGPAAPGEPARTTAADEPAERLGLALCQALLGDTAPDGTTALEATTGRDGTSGQEGAVALVMAQARAIVEVYRTVLEQNVTAEPARLREIAEALWRLNRRAANIAAVMTPINDCARRLIEAAPWPDHLHGAVLQTGVALAYAENHDQRLRYGALDDAIGAQYEIDMDLLRRGETDARDLNWVSPALLTAGCLGLWTGPPGPDGDRPVRIVGAYDKAAQLQRLVGLETSVRRFPPPELVQRADPGQLEVVHVTPVKAEPSDWGVLAILSPVQADGRVTRDRFSHWAALLSVALDQEKLLNSLRQQRTDLARSYQRERNLTETVRASEERYALAARAANDGLWDWNVGSGTIYYSPRWKAMIGYSDDRIGDSPDEWFSRVHPDDRVDLDTAIDAQLSGTVGTLEHQHRLRTADGGYRWMLCRALAVRDPVGRATRIVGSFTDVTERTELEEKLRQRALYDQVTGLPNRSFFQDVLTASISRANRRADVHFAVLFLDLDGFKVVNDSLGHTIGDRLLVGVAERLRSCLRSGDMAARFGGDEFAILLDDMRSTDVPEVVRRLQDALREPFQIDGHEVVVSASIGVALSTTGYDSAADVLRDADIAMYRSKTRERGSYTVFNVTMRAGAERRMRTEVELRAALENDQFDLLYQPIVELATGRVAALEALLRWSHPTHGLINPGQFLPIAEETGLIVPIGHWVIAQACRDIAYRRQHTPANAAGDLPVSINVSNRQFWHGILLPHIIDALRKADIDARCLAIEITEGVIMHNPELALRTLQQLRAHDLALHIDDFGTGYSSLGSLRRFPIQAVKIDRSFVAALGADDKDTELVSTILAMGRNLGVDVIAEGVETAVQAAVLHRLGCRYVQGYYYAKPLPNHAIPALIGSPFPVPSTGRVASLDPPDGETGHLAA